MTPTFADHIVAERARLNSAVADAAARAHTIDQELTGYRRELAALDAYDASLKHKPAAPSRGSKQQTLLVMIQGSTGGMTRADIIEAVGVKGDKKAEAALSNTLATMKNKGMIALTDGLYTAA